MDQPRLSDKAHLRQQFESRRDSLSAEERADFSMQACGRLASLIESLFEKSKAKAMTVGSYRSIKSEVQLNQLADLLPGGVSLVYPKVSGDEMNFFSAETFSLGAYGIEEPESEGPSADQQIDLLLIPGVGFVHAGARLGYGKGFYDHWLEAKNVLKIGVAFCCQISEQSFLSETHDVAMDFLVTERFVLGTESETKTLERAV